MLQRNENEETKKAIKAFLLKIEADQKHYLTFDNQPRGDRHNSVEEAKEEHDFSPKQEGHAQPAGEGKDKNDAAKEAQ